MTAERDRLAALMDETPFDYDEQRADDGCTLITPDWKAFADRLIAAGVRYPEPAKGQRPGWGHTHMYDAPWPSSKPVVEARADLVARIVAAVEAEYAEWALNMAADPDEETLLSKKTVLRAIREASDDRRVEPRPPTRPNPSRRQK